MPTKSIVKGNILNYDQTVEKNIFVDAYHLAGIPKIGPYYYLGGSKLDPNGKFEISFPTEAYGVLGLLKRPNIELRINNSYRVLYIHPVRFVVIENYNNDFKDLEISQDFIYSDQISHTSWFEIIQNGIEDISHLSKQEIKAKLSEFMTPIETAIYVTEIEQKRLNYRGVNVPKRPKTESHSHTIPWNSNVK